MSNNLFLRSLWVWAAFTVATVTAAQEARIEGKDYTTLQDAIKASSQGDVIVLLKDIANDNFSDGHTALSYSLNTGTTLDGDNHKISGDVCIYISAGGGAVKNVDFQDIHNTTVTDASGYGLSEKKEGNLSAIYSIGLTGKAEITGCTFNNIDWDAIQITPKAGAAIRITDNVFRHTNAETSQIRYIHAESGSTAKLKEATITDNRFYKSASNNIEAIGVYLMSGDTPVQEFSGNYVEDTKHLTLEVWTTAYASSAYPFSAFWPMRSQPDIDTDDKSLNVYDDDKNTYPTLAEAISQTGDEKTVIYINQDNQEDITIPSGKSFVFDDGGKYKMSGKITNNGTLYISPKQAAVGHSAVIANNGTLTLNSDNSTTFTVKNAGTLCITGGQTYNPGNIDNSGTVSITGGTFSQKPDDTWLSEWHIANPQEDNTWKVAKMNLQQAVEHGAAASSGKNGGTFYRSLQDAASDTQSPSVHLQKDITENVKDIKSSATYRALYLNGHSFKGSLDMSENLESIKIYGDSEGCQAEITKITGKELYIGSKLYKANVTIKEAILDMIAVEPGGTAVINGGHYGTAETKIQYDKNGDEEPEAVGTLTINGGTFKSGKVKVTYKNHTPSSEEKELSEYITENKTVHKHTYGGQTVYTVMPEAADKNIFVAYNDGNAEYLQATENRITLKDDGVRKVAIENDADDADVVYTRKFTGTNIETWYVPFNMEITEELAQDFQFGKIFSLVVDDITGKATDVVYKKLESGDMLKANTPYFIQLKSESSMTGGEYNAEFTGKGLKKTVATDNVWCATTELKYTFMGSYESFVLKEKPYYALDNSGSFAYSDTDYELQPYRFYMFISDKETGTTIDPRTDTNGVRRLKVISSDGNDGTTGIRINGYGDILPESSSDCRIYDLTGRRVQNARKGIYIIDGKKMIFK